MHTSATCAVYPPSRPTMPRIFTPIDLCVLKSCDQVRTNLFLETAATYRKNKNAVLAVQMTYLQPSLKNSAPTLIVCSRR